MPAQEIPEEFLSRAISSASSTASSTASSDLFFNHSRFIVNPSNQARSLSISSSNTNTYNENDEDIFDASIEHPPVSIEPEENTLLTYAPIKLPSEPTLEELLVGRTIYDY